MEKPFPDVFVAAKSNLRQTVNVSVPQPHRSVKQSWNTKKIRFNFNAPSEHLIWFVSAGRWVFHFRLNFLRSVENSTWTPVLLCGRWMRRQSASDNLQPNLSNRFFWMTVEKKRRCKSHTETKITVTQDELRLMLWIHLVVIYTWPLKV